MISLKPGLRMLAVFIALTLPWSATQALESFSESGAIAAKGINSLTIKDQRYRLHPNVEFNGRGSIRQQVSELEKGDQIAFSYQDIGGDYYIDYIQVLVYEKDEDDE